MITRAEAVALTDLLRTIRPAWDALTTINTLCALNGHDLADIAAAAIRTAQDPQMRSPQTIAFTDSQHWRPTIRDHTPRAVPIWEDTARLQEIDRCPNCDGRGYVLGARPAALCSHDDPQQRAARVKAWADHARAQIRPAPRPNHQETA